MCAGLLVVLVLVAGGVVAYQALNSSEQQVGAAQAQDVSGQVNDAVESLQGPDRRQHAVTAIRIVVGSA